MYMAGLLLYPAYKKWPNLANTSKWFGIPIMSAGLLAASFANDVNTLICTQGAIYAIGGSIVYFPAMLFVDEWFIQRKGLAFGVLWVSSRCASSSPNELPLNHPAGGNRSSRPDNPLPPQQPPLSLRPPHDPPHLVPHNPHPLHAPPLLPPPSHPHLPNLPLPPVRPQLRQESLLLAPASRRRNRKFRLLPPFHLPPHFCRASRLVSRNGLPARRASEWRSGLRDDHHGNAG